MPQELILRSGRIGVQPFSYGISDRVHDISQVIGAVLLDWGVTSLMKVLPSQILSTENSD